MEGVPNFTFRSRDPDHTHFRGNLVISYYYYYYSLITNSHRAISFCMYVRLSVHHTPMLYRNGIIIGQFLRLIARHSVFFESLHNTKDQRQLSLLCPAPNWRGGTGVSGLTRGLATLPPRWIREPSVVRDKDGRPQEDPMAVHCFCVCSGSVLLGDLG